MQVDTKSRAGRELIGKRDPTAVASLATMEAIAKGDAISSSLGAGGLQRGLRDFPSEEARGTARGCGNGQAGGGRGWREVAQERIHLWEGEWEDGVPHAGGRSLVSA